MHHVNPIVPKLITQVFGVNRQNYSRFGLDGHNGWDYRTKWADSPDGIRAILAPFGSFFHLIGDEGNDGYGKYVEVLVPAKRIWKLTFAHCHETPKFSQKKTGEQLAIAGNTGNSTAPHLHLTTKPGRLVNGLFVSENPNNGYKGALDPQEFFNELSQLSQGGSMIDFRQKFLEIAQIDGDQFNPNWTDAEQEVFAKMVQDKYRHYRNVAKNPAPVIQPAPQTVESSADALILAGNLMKQGK